MTDNVINISQGKIGGEFRVIVRDELGRVSQDTGWFKNLITDAGLLNMAHQNSWASNFNVGSSNQAPAFTDTSLYGWMDDTFSGIADSGGAGGSGTAPSAPNYEYYNTNTARFAANTVVGTLREIGCNSHLVTSNTDLSVRALITPEVVVPADYVVDVYYKLTQWPDMTEQTGTVDIGGTSYNYVLRRAWMVECCGLYSGISTFGTMGLQQEAYNHATYGTEIAGVEDGPVSSGISNPTNDGYGNITYSSGQRDDFIQWYITRGIGDIRSMSLRESANGNANRRGWQIRLGKVSDDSPLTKTDTERLRINFRCTWNRL